MAYESQSSAPARRPHSLTVQQRKKMTLTGVEDVDSFDESRITLHTSEGALIIKGSDLQIGALSLETGELGIEGLISELRYEETAASGSLWTRLFR